MTEHTQSYTEKIKEIQEKLKKRSEEVFQVGPDCNEPQATGNPHKALEEDKDMKGDK